MVRCSRKHLIHRCSTLCSQGFVWALYTVCSSFQFSDCLFYGMWMERAAVSKWGARDFPELFFQPILCKGSKEMCSVLCLHPICSKYSWQTYIYFHSHLLCLLGAGSRSVWGHELSGLTAGPICSVSWNLCRCQGALALRSACSASTKGNPGRAFGLLLH